MAEEYATPEEDQAAFDVEFTYMMECERTLDEVIDKLAVIGVKVKPYQRATVSRWLDLFSANSPIPLTHRVAMLRGMLAGSRERRG